MFDGRPAAACWLRLRLWPRAFVNSLKREPRVSAAATPQAGWRGELPTAQIDKNRGEAASDRRAVRTKEWGAGERRGSRRALQRTPRGQSRAKRFDLLITSIYLGSSLRQKNRPEGPAFEGKPTPEVPSAAAQLCAFWESWATKRDVALDPATLGPVRAASGQKGDGIHCS